MTIAKEFCSPGLIKASSFSRLVSARLQRLDEGTYLLIILLVLRCGLVEPPVRPTRVVSSTKIQYVAQMPVGLGATYSFSPGSDMACLTDSGEAKFGLLAQSGRAADFKSLA